MSTGKQRLDKAEGCLTHKQAVILWLQETHEFQSLVEYVKFMCTQPDSMMPLRRLPERADRTVKEAMRGQPKHTVEAAIRRAILDIAFLVHLHHQVNIKVLSEQRAWGLAYYLLIEKLHRIIAANTYQNILRKRQYEIDEANREEEIQTWKALTAQFLIEIYGFQQAFFSISKHYFDGHQVLYPDLANGMSQIIEDTENLVALFNRIAEKHSRINLEALRKDAGEETAKQINCLVDMAKADALDAVGEDRAAAELVERHL